MVWIQHMIRFFSRPKEKMKVMLASRQSCLLLWGAASGPHRGDCNLSYLAKLNSEFS